MVFIAPNYYSVRERYQYSNDKTRSVSYFGFELRRWPIIQLLYQITSNRILVQRDIDRWFIADSCEELIRLLWHGNILSPGKRKMKYKFVRPLSRRLVQSWKCVDIFPTKKTRKRECSEERSTGCNRNTLIKISLTGKKPEKIFQRTLLTFTNLGHVVTMNNTWRDGYFHADL